MNCQNYSATLVGWANNPATPNGRTIGASGRQYGTDAVAARTLLDIDKTWNFSGDASSGMACLPTPTLSSIANQATCDGQTISNIAITLGVDLEAVLSASDDNTNLNPTYTFGGTGANRTLTIATVAGQVGATTVTVTAMGSFGTSTTRTFLLEVGNKTLSYTAGTETSVISQENGISGLAIANDGKIYVGLANTINKIRQYDATGGLVNADYISLNNPRVLYFGADGKLYVMSNSKDIRKYNGQSLEQSIDFVSVSSTDLVTNAAGDVFYVNTQSKPNGGVSKLPANFTQSSTPQNIINNLASPFSLALSPDGSTLYVPITSENRVIKINADGSNASDFILTTSPTNVAFDKSGQLWLGHNGKLSWVGPNGELNTVINSGLSLNSLEFDADGNIYGLRGSGSSQGVYKYTITKTAIYETCNAKPVFNPTTLANRTLCVSPTQVSLPNISITVTDPDGNIAGTVVTSSNPSLIVATNGGTASAVQLSLTQQANQSGTATITIESTDDLGGKSTLSFSITVNPTPNATATPSTQTICSAGAITPIVLTSNLTGTTYTWSRDNTGTVTGMANSGSGDISGTLSNPTNAPVTVTFTIVPTGSAGNCPGTPITASVTVNPVSAGGSIGGAAAVCTGTNSTVLTLSNQVGSIQKWQSSLTSNFANPTDIPNTATVLTASNLTQATYYRAVVQSGVCAPVFSASATITVDPVNVGGSAAGSATVCSGTNSTALTLSNQVGSIQKWQSSLTSNFANPTDIANTATGLTASNLTQTTYYRAVVQSGVCAAAFSSTATVTVNPLPTAGISGTTAVCQNASSPSITFTGGNGTAPYTFTYTLNGETKTITAVSGNSVSISQTTAVANTFTYTLVSVKDASSTQCSQSQGGTAIVTVNVPPVVSTPQTELCTGQTLTLSPTSGGIWVSSNPTVASVTNAGLVTGLSAGAVNFTYTPTTTGCSVTTNNLLIKQTPSSALTASKYDVCPNTTITLDAHCSIPTATVNWNPGAPTVTPNAATLPYLYKARCVADGCTGNESSVEVRTHRILVDMKDLDVGVLPLPIARAVKDNLAPTNLIEAPTFPRRWTFMANGCDASESAVFILSGPVNFSAIDNTDIYALFSNEGTNFYSLDHPNYGNGGSFPNGTYTLTIDLRSRDGAGGPFPKNRIATGSLLASRTLQFTVKSPASIAGSRQGSMSSDLVTAEGVGFAEIAPNPVSHLMRLKVAEAKGQSVKVSLMDAVGRTMLQRSFVPETNQHQEEFEVSHLTHGMYFLRVNAGDKQTTLKVVKVE
jgi:sugar lactone lactonase YvrE